MSMAMWCGSTARPHSPSSLPALSNPVDLFEDDTVSGYRRVTAITLAVSLPFCCVSTRACVERQIVTEQRNHWRASLSRLTFTFVNPDLWHASNVLNYFYTCLSDLFSALEVFFNAMRHISLRFTYLLTYSHLTNHVHLVLAATYLVLIK